MTKLLLVFMIRDCEWLFRWGIGLTLWLMNWWWIRLVLVCVYSWWVWWRHWDLDGLVVWTDQAETRCIQYDLGYLFHWWWRYWSCWGRSQDWWFFVVWGLDRFVWGRWVWVGTVSCSVWYLQGRCPWVDCTLLVFIFLCDFSWLTLRNRLLSNFYVWFLVIFCSTADKRGSQGFSFPKLRLNLGYRANQRCFIGVGRLWRFVRVV